jgi:hypothetical protein
MGQADGRAQGYKPGRPHDHPRVPLHAWAKPTAELKAISQGDRTAIPTTEAQGKWPGRLLITGHRRDGGLRVRRA